jgi:hypothetical protein
MLSAPKAKSVRGLTVRDAEIAKAKPSIHQDAG